MYKIIFDGKIITGSTMHETWEHLIDTCGVTIDIAKWFQTNQYIAEKWKDRLELVERDDIIYYKNDVNRLRKWFFPCKLNKYDILGSFLKNGFVDYGTNLNLSEGDEVFIYTGAPYSAIFLKCRVRAILRKNETINDSEFILDNQTLSDKSKYVRLVPIKNYLNKIDKVNHTELKNNGIKGFSYQTQLSQQTVNYLDSI